ncbi:MAG: transposase [Calothrix sp. FI2-JRJ7]|jgi:predicted transposase YdaD|nr:transposase [Calothrix sp. FI2-JRJ7]
MTQSADISSKRIIGLEPLQWAQWITGSSDIAVQEVVNSEFQWVSRDSDVLIKASSPNHGDFLILNELQLRYKTKMPRRVRAYTGLAEEKFNLPVYPVLINFIKDSDTPIPTRFKSKFMGLVARQDYRVINLWEVDVQLAFQKVSSLIPFAPILKNGDNKETIQQALRVMRADEKLNELETVLGFFATFVLDSAIVQSIMGWDMAILQESPWYRQICKESEEIGEQRGEQRGIISAIELGLDLKFGAQGLELMESISQIPDLEKLKTIRNAIKSAQSLDQLRQLI